MAGGPQLRLGWWVFITCCSLISTNTRCTTAVAWIRALFHPANSGCPGPLDELQEHRRTEVIYGVEARDEMLTGTVDDNWKFLPPEQQPELRCEWTGETIFWKRSATASPAALTIPTSSQPTGTVTADPVQCSNNHHAASQKSPRHHLWDGCHRPASKWHRYLKYHNNSANQSRSQHQLCPLPRQR